MLSEEQKIIRLLMDQFQLRWQSQVDVAEINFLLGLTSVSHEQNEHMIREITEEEISQAVYEMSFDRAPGPDGSQAFFFQNFWYIVNREVIDAIMYIFTNGQMPTSWKETYIVLLSKKKNPLVFNDYRPISLCNKIGRAHV